MAHPTSDHAPRAPRWCFACSPQSPAALANPDWLRPSPCGAPSPADRAPLPLHVPSVATDCRTPGAMGRAAAPRRHSRAWCVNAFIHTRAPGCRCGVVRGGRGRRCGRRTVSPCEGGPDSILQFVDPTLSVCAGMGRGAFWAASGFCSPFKSCSPCLAPPTNHTPTSTIRPRNLRASVR